MTLGAFFGRLTTPSPLTEERDYKERSPEPILARVEDSGRA